MNGSPGISITRNGQPLIAQSFDSSNSIDSKPVLVNEMQLYGIEINSPEIEQEYGLWIGDLPASQVTSSDNQPSSTLATLFAGIEKAVWRDAFYFEGCRGQVKLIVRCRAMGAERWNERCTIKCIVTSGKLSEEKYRCMLDQLSGLAFGLVFDLVSKSQLSAGSRASVTRQSIRSSSTELRIIEAMWPFVSQCLSEILKAPETKLTRRRIITNCWGGERFDARSLATLAQSADTPLSSTTRVPFRASVQRVEESVDTYEHRVIVGFLNLLSNRLMDCIANLKRHIESLVADKPWRDIEIANGISLYRTEDLPRIEQLQLRLEKAGEILSQVKQVRRQTVLREVRPERWTSTSIVFKNVSSYRRIEDALLRYRRSSLVIVEDGTPEKVKATSRLYEQWCFLQIVAALRHLGLTCVKQSGVLHTVHKYRFTIDIDRGAQVTFLGQDGRSLVVRFEPWIMPISEAKQNRDSLYRGTKGVAAWSPDITLEFLAKTNDAPQSPIVDFVAVIDAKYTNSVREHHWTGTEKYLEIREVRSGKQIVRQHWLAFPGDERNLSQSILMRDPTISWTSSGPTCDQTETVQGVLALTPELTSDSDGKLLGWINPTQTAIQFIDGILRFLNFSTQLRPSVLASTSQYDTPS